MRTEAASPVLIVFAVLALLFAQATKAVSAVTAFDGNWSVTENGHGYKNPDGSVTLGGVRRFRAKIKNGVLHGESGVRDVAKWFQLNGQIAADGTAILRANGLTGDPAYNLGHGPSDKPFEYEVIAQFDGRHGIGKSDIHEPPGRTPPVRIFTFVKDTVDDVYRRVADLLLSHGNIAEGEQVLRLLKQKEYHNFFPGESKDDVADSAPQAAYDQKWQERFNAIRDQLAAIGREYSALIKKDQRTDEENQRLSALQSDLATAQQALEQLYRDIATAGSPEKARDLQESGETLMQNLPTIDSGAVVIETVVLEDKYRVILTTPDVQIPAEYEISREALRKKAFAFRDAINARAPESEVKALGNELY